MPTCSPAVSTHRCKTRCRPNAAFSTRRAAKPFAFAGPALEDSAIFGPGTAIGLRKEDTDLKEKLDGAIAAMIKDGTYKRIEQKYFDFDIYGE